MTLIKLGNELLDNGYLRNWGDKWYTSCCDINDAFRKGIVNREVNPTEYGAHYTYFTKEGKQICSFYKDSTFGFGSQYYGPETVSPSNLFPELFTDEAFEARTKERRRLRDLEFARLTDEA